MHRHAHTWRLGPHGLVFGTLLGAILGLRWLSEFLARNTLPRWPQPATIKKNICVYVFEFLARNTLPSYDDDADDDTHARTHAPVSVFMSAFTRKIFGQIWTTDLHTHTDGCKSVVQICPKILLVENL